MARGICADGVVTLFCGTVLMRDRVPGARGSSGAELTSDVAALDPSELVHVTETIHDEPPQCNSASDGNCGIVRGFRHWWRCHI